MFKFVKDKMENKLINIINAGWHAVELNPNNPAIRGWSFMSENAEYNVIATYNKRTGMLMSINGNENSMWAFLTSTEEFSVASTFAAGMTAKRYKQSTPAGSGVAVKLFNNKF